MKHFLGKVFYFEEVIVAILFKYRDNTSVLSLTLYIDNGMREVSILLQIQWKYSKFLHHGSYL